MALAREREGIVRATDRVEGIEQLNRRLPESEIYGRSLSTIHRLGVLMVNNSGPEVITSPEADQARIEFYTSVEEGFGTDMELGGGLEVRDFDTRPVIDGRVMAKDLKTPISQMTESGLTCAFKTASNDARFAPQLTRSEWDHNNALIVDTMARGETTYNTRIVVSPFPEEAAAQSGNEYWRNIGYVPHLKRGFVQLYHAADGQVISGSLSFDGSNKQLLRAVFGQFGVNIPEAEITDNWLQYAITDTLTEDQARTLATALADQAGSPEYKKTTNTVDVTSTYRAVMDKVFNQSYVHICESLARGHQTRAATGLIHQLADKAHCFNARYANALYRMRANTSSFTDDDSTVLHELLVYSTIEMMRAFHLEKGEPHSTHTAINTQLSPTYLQSIDPAAFQNMLGGFGAIGAQNGRTYSACGLAISLGGDREDMDSPQEAYGGTDKKDKKESDEECEFISKSCPKCGAKNVKTKVTKTHISGACGCKVKK